LTFQIVADTFVSLRSLKYRPTLFFKREKAMKPLMFTGSNGDRRRFIGGSDARVIMGQDEKALIRLWEEKRGEASPEDLSGNLLVQLGLVTEDLNRHWYECNTGSAIGDVQSRVKHPVIRWMAATLDGIVEQTGAVYEAKFMLPWSFSEEFAAEKYMAQLQHNMWVTNAWKSTCTASKPAACTSPQLWHHGRNGEGPSIASFRTHTEWSRELPYRSTWLGRFPSPISGVG
jgi:YqaJ-like viral recombinase domain